MRRTFPHCTLNGKRYATGSTPLGARYDVAFQQFSYSITQPAHLRGEVAALLSADGDTVKYPDTQ